MTISISKFRKILYAALALLTICCMSITNTYAWGRKLIPKTINGSMTVYSAYHYNYYFTANAVLTYNDNSTITQISDLSFTNIGYTASQPSLSATFIPKQISKVNRTSYATYTVQLTRNIYGYYVDNVNYTITYRPTDSGSPYSLGDQEQDFIVEVEVSEPYNIQFLKEPN